MVNNCWLVLSFRKVSYCVLSFYVVVICYYGVHNLKKSLKLRGEDKAAESKSISIADVVDDPDWNPWGEEFESEVHFNQHHEPPELWQQQEEPQVEVNDFFHVDHAHRLLEEQSRRVRPEEDSAPRPQEKHNKRARDLVTKNLRPAEAIDDAFNIVEVWGKAAISLYLWQHIIDANLEDRLSGVWQYGEKIVGKIKFRFRTGPGVIPSKVPRETEHLLLVINGRSPSKIKAGKVWLDSLPAFPRLKNVAVVMLGMENCDNSWFHPYLESHGGRVKALFVIYDSPEVDNINVFQWPLGVATYRDFPVVQNSDLYTEKHRRYMFNFLGTIYPNSSRETLLTVVKNSPQRDFGYVRARAQWQPEESPESKQQYLYALSNSDLTLSPVGINTECYRIFEAMAMGSVPVVEDIMTQGYCGNNSLLKGVSKTLLFSKDGQRHRDSVQNELGKSHKIQPDPKFFYHSKVRSRVSQPLRLLKEFDAPVIYVRDWSTDLQDILGKEASLSSGDKKARRRALLRWYTSFLTKMRHRLVSVLEDKFFHRGV